MPTNISRPNWCCDICRRAFGENRDAAARCEAAGPPVTLPDGELLLDYRDTTWPAAAGFVLRRVFRYPGRVGTVASEWNTASGHTVTYLLDVDPAAHRGPDGRLRFDTSPPEVSSEHLRPHKPRALNVRAGGWFGGGPAYRADTPWRAVTTAFGLGSPEASTTKEPSPHWARPITPAVMAVLDELGAYPVPLPPAGGYVRDRALGAMATAACRAADGTASTSWARWWLRTMPAGPTLFEADHLWRRWRAGDCVHVPLPYLSCRRNLTASKLSRQLRELVAATSVPWPPRTDSDAYVRLLIDDTLGYTMDTTDLLFRASHVIAVTGRKGGVGKSTVAAALSRRLAATGSTVVLIDLDLTGPSQHLIHHLGPVPTEPARCRILPAPTDQDRLRVFSPGQVFGPDSRDRWSESSIEQWLSFIGSCLAIDDADVVVLDLPPGDSAVHDILNTHYKTKLDVAIHVTTAHPLALADTERGLARHTHHGGARRVLVENLSRAVGVTETGQTAAVQLVGDPAAARALADRHRVEWGGSLPWAATVAELAAATEMHDLADRLAPPGHAPAHALTPTAAASPLEHASSDHTKERA